MRDKGAPPRTSVAVSMSTLRVVQAGADLPGATSWCASDECIVRANSGIYPESGGSHVPCTSHLSRRGPRRLCSIQRRCPLLGLANHIHSRACPFLRISLHLVAQRKLERASPSFRTMSHPRAADHAKWLCRGVSPS